MSKEAATVLNDWFAGGQRKRSGGRQMAKQNVTVTVNGTRYQRDIEPRLLLSDFLRHELSLTGTHVGCEHGVCGSCTVLVDGIATRSCLFLAVQADGLSVETVESLGKVGALHALQQAFWEKHGLQCGFCTPGMLMSVSELLRANPAPDRDAIVEAIGGNLCRCTGYQNIVEAVEHAVELLRTQKEAA
jgi:aerobic carbon-monoxide dehydrogenase small subunit